MRAAYTYTILRYVHDTTTGEFLNVGVALYSPERSFARALCRKSYGRVSKTFPGVNGKTFRAAVHSIGKAFSDVGKTLRTELQFETYSSALEIALGVLPHDDSSFQWGSEGAGLTEDPDRELEALYSRYVSRYDEASHGARRSDDDVWRTYKGSLEQRNVLQYLQPKTIEVADDEIVFSHACKNGVWHCLEPLSFDLALADSIKEKAHKWLGHITSVKDSHDAFKVYFLLGEPQEEHLREAVNNAVRILEKIPVEKKVIRESDAGDFSADFAGVVTKHSGS